MHNNFLTNEMQASAAASGEAWLMLMLVRLTGNAIKESVQISPST